MRKWGISAAFVLIPVVAILISAQAAGLAWERQEPTPLTAPHLGAPQIGALQIGAPHIGADQPMQKLAPVSVGVPTAVTTVSPDASHNQANAVTPAANATAGGHDRTRANARVKLKIAEAAIARMKYGPSVVSTSAPTAVPANMITPVTRVASMVVQPANAAATPAPAESPQPLAIPDRVYAPTIRLDTSVTPVGWKEVKTANGTTRLEWVVASYQAGWHKNSALPGQGGNIVLAAHNNMEGEIFRYIELLKPGDPIFLYAGGRKFKYIVSEKFAVQEKGVSEEKRRENAKWIGPFPEERLTLISCWPYTGDTHRMFVIAKPAP